MRNVKANRKTARPSEQGISGLRGLATSLVNSKSGHIVTTFDKAKELGPYVGKAIKLAKKAHTLSGKDAKQQEIQLRQQAAGYFIAGSGTIEVKIIGNEKSGSLMVTGDRADGILALQKLFDDLGARYKDRDGGYTRIIRVGQRTASNAEMAVIELVDNPYIIEVEDFSQMIQNQMRIDDLSDAEVIQLTELQMPEGDQEELDELIHKEKTSSLSSSETKRLDHLMDIYHDALLRKSEAFAVASKRGLLDTVKINPLAATAREMRAE